MNKRINTQKRNVSTLKDVVTSKEKKELLQAETLELNENLENALKECNKKYYWKNPESFLQSYADEFNQQIFYLQNEKMEDFLQN